MRSVEEQQARITAAAVAPRPLRVAIAEAQGLMCAEEVVTERPMPGPAPNTAMVLDMRFPSLS